MSDIHKQARLFLAAAEEGMDANFLLTHILQQHSGAYRQERLFKFDEPVRPVSSIVNQTARRALAELAQGS